MNLMATLCLLIRILGQDLNIEVSRVVVDRAFKANTGDEIRSVSLEFLDSIINSETYSVKKVFA